MHTETSSPDEAPDTTLDQHQDQATDAYFAEAGENVVLPTALVAVRVAGETFNLRALIDPGSQSSYIVEKVQKRLALATEPF